MTRALIDSHEIGIALNLVLSLIFAFLEYAAGIFVGPPCPVSLHLGPLWTVGGEADTRGSPTFYYYYYYCHYEGQPHLTQIRSHRPQHRKN